MRTIQLLKDPKTGELYIKAEIKECLTEGYILAKLDISYRGPSVRKLLEDHFVTGEVEMDEVTAKFSQSYMDRK